MTPDNALEDIELSIRENFDGSYLHRHILNTALQGQGSSVKDAFLETAKQEMNHNIVRMRALQRRQDTIRDRIIQSVQCFVSPTNGHDAVTIDHFVGYMRESLKELQNLPDELVLGEKERNKK